MEQQKTVWCIIRNDNSRGIKIGDIADIYRVNNGVVANRRGRSRVF
jgi:hypothetical protein